MNPRFTRCAAAVGIAATALITGQLAAQAANAPSAARPKSNSAYVAANAPSTVDFDSSPNINTPGTTGFITGDKMTLVCYEFGGSAGPYANTLWYEATDTTRGGSGWVNDHYLNTPDTAANPQPVTGTGECNPSGYGVKYDSGPTFNVTGAATSTQNWQSFDDSPNPNDYRDPQSGWYLNGDPVQLFCYEYGAPVGTYGNTLWYIAYDPERGGTYGWINDHYLTTPDTAANPVPQTSKHC